MHNITYYIVLFAVVGGLAALCLLSLLKWRKYCQYDTATGTVLERKIFGYGKSLQWEYTISYYHQGAQYTTTTKPTHAIKQEGSGVTIAINPENPSDIMLASGKERPLIWALLSGTIAILCLLGG